MQLSMQKKPGDQSTGIFSGWNESDFFSPELPDFFRWFRERRHMQKWLPKVDISETDEMYELLMDVPSVKANEMKIEYDDEYITILGKTVREKENTKKEWYRLEREVGEFQRSFRLPEGVLAEKMNAQLDGGVLRITIPKATPSTREVKKTVPIQSQS